MTHARSLERYSGGKLGYGPGRDTDSLIFQPPPIFAQIIDIKTYCEVLSPITLKVESYKVLLCHRNFLTQVQRTPPPPPPEEMQKRNERRNAELPVLIILIDKFERVRKGFSRITKINHRKNRRTAQLL